MYKHLTPQEKVEFMEKFGTIKHRGFPQTAILSFIDTLIGKRVGEIREKLAEAKCYHSPARGVLLSNPPQYQCEACGQRWVCGTEIPVCLYVRKEDIVSPDSPKHKKPL